MNTKATVAEQIYRVRKIYPGAWNDPNFYPAKHYMRKRLRSILGKNFVVIIEGEENRGYRVYYGSESVVI